MNKLKFIKDTLQKRYDYLLERGYNVMAVFLQGSQNYDLDIYTDEYQSDIDVKAIVLPTLDEIVKCKSPISTTIVLDNNEHIEIKDIRVMSDMFIKQNISYIELLYTDYYIVNPVYEENIKKLIENRERISKINYNKFLKCIYGMSREKLKAMEHPYPNIKDKIEKYGYDPKQLHHIARLNDFLVNLLVLKKDLKTCYKPKENKDYLIYIKKGGLDLIKARSLANNLVEENLKLIKEYSLVKDTVDYQSINFLKSWMYSSIKKSLEMELSKKNDKK